MLRPVDGRTPRRSTSGAAGAGMVLVSVVTMQSGQVTAKLGFAFAAPLVITALRFGFGALVLCSIRRPRAPDSRRTLLAVIALGGALAGVNVTVYEAAARMPLGLAVTVQCLGGLALSLAGSRRALDVVWGLLAAGGVVLTDYGPVGTLSPAGMAFALASAACWAAYILLGAHLAARWAGGQGLSLATVVAAVVTVPFAVGTQARAFADPRVVGIGLAVALLSTVLANSVELRALQRIPAPVFGVLVSLEPAAASLIGLLVLGERLAPAQWAGVAAIVAASAGVTARVAFVRGGAALPPPAGSPGAEDVHDRCPTPL